MNTHEQLIADLRVESEHAENQQAKLMRAAADELERIDRALAQAFAISRQGG